MTEHSRWEILDGLPTYGPLAESFTATGFGTHSEGLVARFRSSAGVWVGNFQRGMSSCDQVCEHPDGCHVVVVAGGTAYVVNPETRTLSHHFGAQIEIILVIDDLRTVVFGNGLWFEALGADGLQWRSRRFSWDGVRNVARSGGTLRGEAYAPEGADGAWYPFEVDLATGDVTGGSYTGPM